MAPTTLHMASARGASREPLIQRATLVRLKVAEADVPERCRIDDLGHGLTNQREHLLHPGLKQQRLVVFDQELVKLKVEIRTRTC